METWAPLCSMVRYWATLPATVTAADVPLKATPTVPSATLLWSTVIAVMSLSVKVLPMTVSCVPSV